MKSSGLSVSSMAPSVQSARLVVWDAQWNAWRSIQAALASPAAAAALSASKSAEGVKVHLSILGGPRGPESGAYGEARSGLNRLARRKGNLFQKLIHNVVCKPSGGLVVRWLQQPCIRQVWCWS